ncbi:MAG: magnesium and cobalt transport protein CorA [Prevotellaceae bacterium]|jgi:magnesium transporter|nr:magnesium and cobalt transport protein CorA [Prevotellaceae bacterium]
MITTYYKALKQINSSNELSLLEELGYDDILWIDLNCPTGEEKRAIEDYLETPLQTRAKAEEIESSSRYSETENAIFANSEFLIAGAEDYQEETVSFILASGILVTVRNTHLRTFMEIERRLMINPRGYATGYHLMVSILENRIDLDADMIELLAKEIAQLNKRINAEERISEEMLYDINQLQENTMTIRENIIDKQRMISSILKSDKFPSDIFPKLNVMIRDVGSLLNHTDFSFERLEYLQNTVLGLINLEQNKIIKVFTVVTVFFMPPTLISSIYGMNVKLPFSETGYWGFASTILFMIMAFAVTVLYFKRKKLL